MFLGSLLAKRWKQRSIHLEVAEVPHDQPADPEQLDVVAARPNHKSDDGPPSPPAELLTEAEVAAVLRSDPDHIRRLVRQRQLAALREGHWVRIRPADLAEFLERARVKAVEE